MIYPIINGMIPSVQWAVGLGQVGLQLAVAWMSSASDMEKNMWMFPDSNEYEFGCDDRLVADLHL